MAFDGSSGGPVPRSSNHSRPVARLLGWLGQAPRRLEIPDAGGRALAAYVALGHWSPARATLDTRLELLIRELSAELSACRWCIAESRHRWLKAFLPVHLLHQVRSYEVSPAFTESERSALALAEAVARHSDLDPVAPERALERARRHFAEAEVACLAAAGAGEHFFNPVTGAIGRDALTANLPSDDARPWHAIDKGIVLRGLS